MSREQVKGTLLTVGATAASTALLVGGFVGYNHMQRTTASVDVVDTFNQMEAKKVAAEDVQHGVFSDHCLVATVGDWTMDLISWVPEKPENGGQPVDDAWGNTHPAANILDTDNLAGSYNWQWVNRVTGSYQAAVPGTGTTYTMLSPIVADPSNRTQANLNAWLNQIKASDNGGHLMIGWGNPSPERAQTYPYNVQRVFAPIAAHCRWMPTVEADSTSHKTDTDDVLRSDVTVGNDTSYGSDPWLSVDGDQAVVKATGRAYYSATQAPAQSSTVPAGAQLIGETTLTFNGPGTQTGSITKPENLDGGYITWVWTVDRSEQGDWANYMDNEAASTNYGEDANTVNVPKKPKPAPISNATQPSTAPARSNAETPAAPAASTIRSNGETTTRVSRGEASTNNMAPSIEAAPSKVEEMLLSEQSSVAAPASTPEKKTEIANTSNSLSGDNVRSATIPLVLLVVEALSILGGLLFMRRR